MAKRTAVLIDGGFLRKKLAKQQKAQKLADAIVVFAKACLDPASEELYRIFYYDCPPYKGAGVERPHPILGPTQPMSTQAIAFNESFLHTLKQEECVAVRSGELSFDGWVLKEQAVSDIVKTGRSMQSGDFVPNLRQKGVDLRIGVDVTLLAKDRLVDRIVIVSADSDLVPAMKLARREGVQIVLVSLDHGSKPLLREHSDFYRKVPV
jgi:uncharacterized LabA/DUF88 family protein